MIHRVRLAVLGVLLLAAGPAVLADEVVHFTNGTYLKIQTYSVDGDMIRVVLGPDASMAFPKSLVESIERAGRTIYPQTQAAGPANVVTSGGVGGQVSGVGPYVQTGEHQIPARYRRNAARGDGPAEEPSAAEVEEARRPAIGEFQLPGRRGVLRTTGRREVPVGEALIEKDAAVPPPSPARPRVLTTLAPRSSSQAPPPESAPPAPEVPDEGSPESDGTANPD